MLTTSSIVVRQRGHGRVLPPRLLLDRSDTIHTPFALGLIDLGSPHFRTLDGDVSCRRGLLFPSKPRLGRPVAVHPLPLRVPSRPVPLRVPSRPVPCRFEFHLEHSETQRARTLAREHLPVFHVISTHRAADDGELEARHEGLEPSIPTASGVPDEMGTPPPKFHSSGDNAVHCTGYKSVASLNWSRNAWNPTHGRALSVRIGRREKMWPERGLTSSLL
jgi:hypothetical protein